MSIGFAWAGVCLAFVAAGLWAKASVVTVTREQSPNKDGFMHEEVNVYPTVRAQGRWNKYAALTTAAASITIWDGMLR